MKAIRIHETGGPEVMRYEDAPDLQPGAGEALVKVHAAGVNFIDVYHRMGSYPLQTPFSPGVEAAGVVEAVGSEVQDVRAGERVAYAMTLGAYADYAVVPAWRLVPVPEGVGLDQAGAVMVQGMTAHYLIYSTYPLKEGETCLVHAAAGGLGLLMVQLAKRQGARVIGTVSTEEKAELAKGAGADEVILYTEQDFEAETRRLTNGEGVEVVYDSVGKTTFERGLNVLKPRGYMVLCGASSGAAPSIDPQILNQKGSLFLTRPTLGHYNQDRAEVLSRAGDLFTWMAAGELNARIDQTFALAEAPDAHRYIEARKTKGKLLLTP